MRIVPEDLHKWPANEKMEHIHEKVMIGLIPSCMIWVFLSVCLIVNCFLYNKVSPVYWFISYPAVALFFQLLSGFWLFLLYRRVRVPMIVKISTFGGVLADVVAFSLFLWMPALITFLVIGAIFKILFLKEWWRHKSSAYYFDQFALFSQSETNISINKK